MCGRVMHSFFHAVGFLTRLPVPRTLRPEAWRHSAKWYPLVGVVIGGILAAAGSGLQGIAPPVLTGMLLVTLWVWLTGGLHLDGLMDTADGFGSYRPRERVLEIMKDSRVGGMGVLAAILLLGNKVGALIVLAEGASLSYALLVAPMMGRGMMMTALYAFPYARQDGLAQELRESGRAYGWGLLLALLALSCTLGWAAVLALVVAAGAVAVLIRSSLKKIGGLTGDVYGAICEVAETAVLLAWAVAWN